MGKRRDIRYFVLIMIFIVSAVVTAAVIFQVKQLNRDTIQNGVLDLSSWNCGDIITLNGTTEFYWEKLLTKNDLAANIKPDCMASIPSVWNYYELNGRIKPSGKGYATYRIHVGGVKPGQPLAMRVQPLSTAYELYIDDELMASCGKVGTTESGTYPQYAIRIFEFTPKNDHFDIIIHISNYVYARGGLWYPIDLGTPGQIDRVETAIFVRDILAIGLFSMLLIYSVFYCILRHDKYLILFMAMDVLLICRTMITGSYIVNSLFPVVNFNVYIWLNYIPICSLASLCLMILYHYFPVSLSPKAVKLSLAVSAAEITAALILPIYLLTQLTYAMLVCSMLFAFYGMWKLINALVDNERGKNLDILFMFVGVIAVILCAILDIMFNENLTKSGRTDSLPIGFMIFILLWNMSIIYRYELVTSDRLRVLQELKVANEREKALELKFLKSQIRPHFINNALNTIISISRTDVDRARLLLVQFSKYLRGRYDFENLDDVIPIEQELEYVRSYLAIETARFRDKLHIEYDIDDVTFCVPTLVLQPLVENAVIHGVRGRSGGGRILIYVKADGPFIKIGVRDDGVGMEPDRIKEVLGGTVGKNGVALCNINERLLKLYNTGLSIISPEGGGLDVSAMIPKGEVE
jgi:Putative regulator of cell autolysis